jgi:putative acyl-CoA dehydrogenase
VLRALGREPQTRDALFDELDAVSGEHRALANATARLRAMLDEAAVLEGQARRVVEQMALCLQAATLLRAGHATVADAFCASRLDGDHGHSFGSLSARAPIADLIERARLAACAGC